jgi:glycosidase
VTDNIERILAGPRPRSIAEARQNWPTRDSWHPSPPDWRDQLIYFALPDRFSDGGEAGRPKVDPDRPAAQRPADFRWDKWAESGSHHYQGGTLAGMTSKLGYLRNLNVGALWVGPVCKQSAYGNDYHGYSIQDFFEVDPRLGTRADLVDLVRQAHDAGMWVILDIIFHHTGENFSYPADDLVENVAPYREWPGRHDFGAWIGADGKPISGRPVGPDDGVWPEELQDPECYTRAGAGSYGGGGEGDFVEFRRADWVNRKLMLTSEDDPSDRGTLNSMIAIWSYLIALTDVDGFRIDTFKHVRPEEARHFCAAIREYAEEIGKDDFLLLAEVGGGDGLEQWYLDALGSNLSAVQSIGARRASMRYLASGGRMDADQPATVDGYFSLERGAVGSHRDFTSSHTPALDDQDDVLVNPRLRYGAALRLTHPAAAPAELDQRVVAGVAVLLFQAGIPCLYYGTEQGLTGPEPDQLQYLHGEGWGDGGKPYSDRFLREAMFGPTHPLALGRMALEGGGRHLDASLPGFGPYGTTGHHAFDPDRESYRQVRDLVAVRSALLPLRRGRQYARQVRTGTGTFAMPAAGGVLPWSRIMGGSEVLCVVNSGLGVWSGDIVVDAAINADSAPLRVVGSTDPAAHPVGSTVLVCHEPDGTAYVSVRELSPAHVLVLTA